MKGHALGERTAWVFAAAVMAFGSSTGSVANRLAGEVTTTSSIESRAAATSQIPRPHDSALAAEATRWPVGALSAAPPPAAPAKPPLPSWVRRYHGVNHVWLPTLGAADKVYSFPCSRSREPDNLVYRWGCAGKNNVYLLGHAYGVFRALYDAYYDGKLKVGMPVMYADGHGRLHLFRVTTWRIVHPADAHWAIAAQAVPSMTLQTCVGSRGTFRLNVRLVEVNA